MDNPYYSGPLTSDVVQDYRCDIEQIDGCVVVAFSGEITTATHSRFRDDYNEVRRQLSGLDPQKLVIDLGNTQFFGSLFVGVVVKIWVGIQAKSGQMALCGLSDQLNDLMKKLLLLERYGDEAGRLKHFATRAAAMEFIAN